MARGLKPPPMSAAAVDHAGVGAGYGRLGGLTTSPLAPVTRRPPMVLGGPRIGYSTQRR